MPQMHVRAGTEGLPTAFLGMSVQRRGLEIINIMNNDGSLNSAAGAYAGMDRFDARKRLWADMQACQPADALPGTRLHPGY